MRTSKSTTCLIILFLYLCCFVQQCQFLMFNLIENSLSSAMTMTSAIGMTIAQSMMQSILTTFAHGFSTLHTMAMSLVSGFIMGNIFLAGFIFFLLALVPAEEYRSLGSSSFFTSPLLQHRRPLQLPFVPPSIVNSSVLDHLNENITLARNKRSLSSLVNRNNNATTLSFTLPSSTTSSSLPKNDSDNQFRYNLRFSSSDDIDPTLRLFSSLNETDSRIPRFLTRLVPRDPFNCLPLLLCGLSAARKPSERTEVLNDYAYLLKEFMEPDEKSNEDSSQEDDLLGNTNKNRFRQDPIKLLEELINKKKKKDDVDEVIDGMRKEEDDNIEDLALTEMADDPNDLKFALEDMKVRGLKKTMSKMPNNSKRNYIAQLMKEDSREESEGEVMDNYYNSEEVPLAMRGHYPRNDYPGSYSYERSPFYDLRDLAKGGYPPLPQEPPVPIYGVADDKLYKKNLNILKGSLSERPSTLHRRRLPLGPPPPFPPRGRRSKRDAKWRNGPPLPPPPRGFLQKKRGEAAAADNIFDKARIGAEVGARAGNNRQCRALFNQCPVESLIRPVGDNNTPFLNRAVNNIRRVLVGTPPEASKQRRVNEIKEVIQQLHPPVNHGGSEVRVVLNIGPSPPPNGATFDLHRAGGSPPPPPHQNIHLSPVHPTLYTAPENDFSNQYTTFKTPSSLKAPMKQQRPSAPSSTPPLKQQTKKIMKYKKPSLPPARPTKDLSHLEILLKTTQPSINSDEDSTTDMPQEETTVITFSDNQDSVEFEGNVSGEMENEPVLPTQFPVSKDEYAQNLRETFDIFKRFKEANKKPFAFTTTSKPNPRPRSTTTKKSSLSQSKIKVPGGKPPGIDPLPIDQPEKDLDHEKDDVQSILDWIGKFREKYFPKNRKKKRKKKKNKKKHGDGSSEESSEEHDPDYHHHHKPTLVAVPPPHLKHQFNWKSGTTYFKDGVYDFFFGGRRVKPLPEGPEHFHPSSESDPEDHFHGKPIRHDVHYHEPASPPVIHYHHQRSRKTATKSSSESDTTEENADVVPTTMSPLPLSSTILSISTKKPNKKLKSKSKSTPKSKPKPKSNPGPLIATRRPIKIKFKTPQPTILPEESEEEDYPIFRGLPQQPPPPPPHILARFPPPPYGRDGDNSGSYEEYDHNEEDRPTKPHMLYTPFTINSRGMSKESIGPPRKIKNKAVSKSKKSNSAARRNTASGTKKSSVTPRSKATSTNRTSTPTTKKPKRKALKYKNG